MFDHVHVPPEEYRVHSGRMDKKVLTADGVEWQGRFAVMTENELCFSSLKGETKEYWPEDTPCSDEELRAVFTRADADGTGTLDESEVQGCLAELNMPNSDKTVQALMSQIDAANFPGRGREGERKGETGRSKSPREAARHTTGQSKSPRMSHGATGSRRLEKFDRFLEKV